MTWVVIVLQNVKIIAMRISNLLKNWIAEILNSVLKKTHKLQLPKFSFI